MNIIDILRFKYPIQFFNGQIQVQDDGKGLYISKWQMGSIPKPTEEQLLAMADEPGVITNQAIYNRVNAADGYGSVADQLDMIYKDLKNGTNLWEQKIDNIKNVLYPKSEKEE